MSKCKQPNGPLQFPDDSAVGSDKVQTGNTTGTSTSTTYKISSTPPTEYGWVCPRCNRVNAPWKSYCDCAGNNYWYPTWGFNWYYREPWWKQVYCDSDTFKVHPETTTWKAPSSTCGTDSSSTKTNPDCTIYTTASNTFVGGSDYWDNMSQVWTNNPEVRNSATSVNSPWNQYYTLTSDKINDLQNQINNLKETK